jgi:hypothetical protein
VGGRSCDGPAGNIAVLEGLNSGSVVVDAAMKDCLDSVSCSYVSNGRSIAATKKLVSVGGHSRDGPAGNMNSCLGRFEFWQCHCRCCQERLPRLCFMRLCFLWS